MHCPAHTKDKTEISQGNELADTAAKAAALQPWKEYMAAIPTQNQNKWPDLTDPKAVYEKDCSVEERKQWEKWEAKQEESGIWTSGGKLILPKKYIVTVARWFHDKTHRGAEAIAEQIQKEWSAPGIHGAAKRVVNSCPTCLKFPDTWPHKEPGGQPWAYFPFQRLQIDYADMPPANGYKHL